MSYQERMGLPFTITAKTRSIFSEIESSLNKINQSLDQRLSLINQDFFEISKTKIVAQIKKEIRTEIERYKNTLNRKRKDKEIRTELLAKIDIKLTELENVNDFNEVYLYILSFTKSLEITKTSVFFTETSDLSNKIRERFLSLARFPENRTEFDTFVSQIEGLTEEEVQDLEKEYIKALALRTLKFGILRYRLLIDTFKSNLSDQKFVTTNPEAAQIIENNLTHFRDHLEVFDAVTELQVDGETHPIHSILTSQGGVIVGTQQNKLRNLTSDEIEEQRRQNQRLFYLIGNLTINDNEFCVTSETSPAPKQSPSDTTNSRWSLNLHRRRDSSFIPTEIISLRIDPERSGKVVLDIDCSSLNPYLQGTKKDTSTGVVLNRVFNQAGGSGHHFLLNQVEPTEVSAIISAIELELLDELIDRN